MIDSRSQNSTNLTADGPNTQNSNRTSATRQQLPSSANPRTSPHTSTLNTIPTTRRGRILARKSSDPHPEEAYGDSIHTKDDTHLRVFFQNVKGLSYTTTSDDYQYYSQALRALRVDISCLAETNKPWQLPHHKNDFRTASRKYLGHIKAEFASPLRTIDQVGETDTFQAGGCVTLASGKWVPSVFGEPIQDTTGLGRWCGFTIRGQHKNMLTIITAYRTCKGNIQSAPLGSTYAREYEFYKQAGDKNPNPRKRFVDDLSKLLSKLVHNGHQLILAMDANSIVAQEPYFQNMLDSHDLVDAHISNNAKSTYIGSENRRIDYMYMSSSIIESITRSGTLSYIDGPQADHRALYIDIDTEKALRFNPTDHKIPSAAMRDLKTGNPELVEDYINSMQVYYINHNMEERITRLHRDQDNMTRDELRIELEKWDADQGRAMRNAESRLSRPPRPYSWSPSLRNAGLIRRYWRLRLRDYQFGEDHTNLFDRLLLSTREYDSNFSFPHMGRTLTIGQIRSELNQATKNLRQMQGASVELRHQFYEDLLAGYLNDTNPTTRRTSLAKAKILENTIRAEQCRQMFRNIRYAVKPMTATSGLQQIRVPRARQDPVGTSNDFHAVLRDNANHEIEWETILDPIEIEAHLLNYNKTSFRAAAVSPCGHGIIHDTLTFSSLSPAGDNVINGILPDEWKEQPKLLRDFLLSFAMPEATPTITSTLTEDQIKYGFKHWKETTSTSPSGRHLGHYRAIISDDTLRKCLTLFMNVTIKQGISISRWQKAANVMIEKDKGQPNINRLRIIHLFEADLNLFLKIQWGRRLIRHAKKHGLLHPCQHGSVPGSTTMDPIMLTQFTNDLCRILKHNLIRFDNDASACYDRIIVALAMLAARRCGMPANAIRTHAETLQYMRYSVKTHYGVTEASYTGTPFEPLFGTGQGSGASPAAWLTLVVVIMNTIDKVIADRMTFVSINGKYQHSRLMDAYVDDTALGISSATDDCDMDSLIARLERTAQTWEQLLFYSGGALNLSKCSWSVTYWKWIKGVPTTCEPNPDVNRGIHLTQQGSTTTTKIRNSPTTEAQKILGVHLAPNGDFARQITALRTKADGFARSLRSPRLSKQDIITFHRTMYTPAMKYALPAVAVDEEELHKIQTGVMAVFLQRLGFSSKLPTAIRHGPLELGGLGLVDLRTELGLAQIKMLRDAIITGKEVGKLAIISLQHSQREAGIDTPLLERPDISLPYLTPTWITSIRQYLYTHNITISVTDAHQIQLSSPTDSCIMQPQYLKGYTPIQQAHINRVRLHLQVATLSDMCDDTGYCIRQECLNGVRCPEFKVCTTWPRQPSVTSYQQRLWRRYLTANFIRYGTKWIHRIDLSGDEPPASGTPFFLQPTKFDSIADYVASLPKWYQRLLQTYHQKATDITIWRSFRSKKKVTIVSDGGLAEGVGTFGWKIIGLDNETLYAGAGPIDGPMEEGSSTRSELGGLTAPLFMVVCLARLWGLKHKCRYRWMVDSRAAISQVKITTRVSHQLRRAPNNSDYLMVIRELRKELGKPLEYVWVKGHQDDGTQYENLGTSAQHNVDVDALATWYRESLPSPPQLNRAHIPEELISISIQGKRISSNIEDMIRYHVNGYYIRQYLQSKKHWKDATWNLVNFPALYRYRKTLSGSEQHWLLKVLHEQLPIGSKRVRTSQVTDDNLSRCPCCTQSIETMSHFLRCDKNEQYTKSFVEFTSRMEGKKTGKRRHVFFTFFQDCIEQWMFQGPELPSMHSPYTPGLSYFNQPMDLQEALSTAIGDQTSIGWDNALSGWLANSWLAVARHGNQPTWEAERRIQIALKGLHRRTVSIWKGRNNQLHGPKELVDAQIYTAESATIRYYHSRPHLLGATDRHYCDRPLLSILRGSPSSRRRWIRRVRLARADYLKDGRLQTKITGYYPLMTDGQGLSSLDEPDNQTPYSPGIHPEVEIQEPLEIQDIEATTHNLLPAQVHRSPRCQQIHRRHVKTQSMITRFYPSARPPDMTTDQSLDIRIEIPRIS
jgi:hypothetical protein